MRENIWAEENNPLCKHYRICKNSCESVGRRFGYGQLPHIGAHYALKRNGKDFRVVISAAEQGEDTSYQSVESRTSQISCLTPGNAHMQGTLIALQLLFEVAVTKGNLNMEIDGKEVQILSAFALPNFLLCSAPWGESSGSAYTVTTQVNCAEHFDAVLGILKPQILIVAGARAHEYLRAYHGMKNIEMRQPKVSRITIGEHATWVLPLYHPSARSRGWAGWGSSRIDEYLRPAINKLHKKFADLL